MRFSVQTPDKETRQYEGAYSVMGNGALQVRPDGEPTITYSSIGWLKINETDQRSAPGAQFA